MSDLHPSYLSEWAMRIMAVVGLGVLVVLSTKLITTSTRTREPVLESLSTYRSGNDVNVQPQRSYSLRTGAAGTL